MKIEDKHDWQVIDIPNLAKLHFKVTVNKLHKLGLYKGQPQMLKCIKENEGITNAEIARLLELEPPTVTVVINRMMARDLIQKKDEGKMYLTKKGKDTFVKCEKIMNEIYNTTYIGFSNKEKEILEKFYARIEKNLKDSIRGNK